MGKKGFKTRKRYRLTFVNENTFNTVWALKLSRVKVWVLSAVCCAAIAALALAVFVWSPLRNFLPGYIKPAERLQIVENTMLVDSMLARTAMQQRYVDNIVSLLSESDSLRITETEREVPEEIADTLISASENEREFVETWMERERGNLSVLTPVVAEGMMFRLPAQGARLLDDGTGLLASAGAPVSAIQDATVIGSYVDPLSGRTTLVLQHSNDFVSICGGMRAAYVTPGHHVVAGQAIGSLGSDGLMPLSVWHQGRRIALPTILPGLRE